MKHGWNRTVIAIVLIAAALAGCSGGSYSIVKGDVTAAQDALSGRYEQFNGHYHTTLKTDERSVVSFTMQVDTESGSLRAVLLDADKDEIGPIEDGAVMVLQPDSRYRVQVEADDHTGSFEVVWRLQ